ncbi:MAG: M28 family peptidase, partial [Raoultibacter sp.]
VLLIPAIILTLITALLLLLEVFGKPVISKLLARGVSQNVVAKYEPGYAADGSGTRRRKVILVSRYDSGKVQPELIAPLLGVLRFSQWSTLIAMVFLPVLLIVRSLFFLHAEGVTAIVFNVLTGIGLFLVAIPLIFVIIHKFSAYNEAANANAAGTAVLLEVARRVGRGRVSAAELAARAEAAGTVIHGEEEALMSGLVPDGAKLAYEAAAVQPPDLAPQTSEARLASAKAAIAALTGKPIPPSEPIHDISKNLVQVKDAPLGEPTEEALKEQRDETREALTAGQGIEGEGLADNSGDLQGAGLAAEGADGGTLGEAVAGDASSVVQGGVVFLTPEPAEPTVPDWFKKAQENAKKPKEKATPKNLRSRYADAFDAAMPESTLSPSEAQRVVDEETEQRLKKMREGFMDTRNSQVRQPQEGSPEDGFAAEDSSAMQDAAFMPGSTTAMPPIDVSDLKASLGEDTVVQPQDEADQPAKPAISLPDIGLSVPSLPQVADSAKQRAPLADAEQAGSTTAKSLLTMLPSIDAEEVAAEKEGKDPAEVRRATDRKPNLATLPSLSGEIGQVTQNSYAQGELQQTGSVSKAGSFASGATGMFAPVGDELIENVAPDDIYIDDADDSEYATGVTETGAFAGPGYVEMPKSRTRRFFDRFSRKKNDEETSAREWLDVDEDFDARSVGAARGGWESFKEDDSQHGAASYGEETFYQEGQTLDGFEDDDFNNGKRPWQGGAFSRRRLVNKDEELEDDFEADDHFVPTSSPSFNREDEQISGELQQIYQFRHPDIDVEVWFVALGSELAGNAGMKAFLAEHGNDLRGSVIINLNALGNGELSYIEKEGLYRQSKASSRMKRYMKKAGQATGIDPQTASINWTDSAASIALRHGYQAMSVVGMDGSKPAFFAQGDDVFENIDPDTLQGNADFVMELLKNI